MKTLSRILKLTTIASAIVGIYLSGYAGREAFMGGTRMFMYFTIQSNIAIALICAVGLYLMGSKKPVPHTWFIVKFVGTVSITLTGAVFAFMLAPILGDQAWNIQNTLTHLIVPVVAILDFFVVFSKVSISKKNVLFVTIPPLLYVVYAGIGFAMNWQFAGGANYPYFFLNWGSPAGAFGLTSELPYLGCVWWILLLLLLLIGVGYLYLKLADIIREKIGGQDL